RIRLGRSVFCCGSCAGLLLSHPDRSGRPSRRARSSIGKQRNVFPFGRTVERTRDGQFQIFQVRNRNSSRLIRWLPAWLVVDEVAQSLTVTDIHSVTGFPDCTLKESDPVKIPDLRG